MGNIINKPEYIPIPDKEKEPVPVPVPIPIPIPINKQYPRSLAINIIKPRTRFTPPIISKY